MSEIKSEREKRLFVCVREREKTVREIYRNCESERERERDLAKRYTLSHCFVSSLAKKLLLLILGYQEVIRRYLNTKNFLVYSSIYVSAQAQSKALKIEELRTKVN